MYKIGVIGDRESILGFKALGLQTFPVTTQEEAEKTLKNLVAEKYGIIYLTEQVYDMVEKETEKHSDSALPAIIPIPGVVGNTGKGISSVKKSVERAVGSDIIFGND